MARRYGSCPRGRSGRIEQAWKAAALLLSADDERGAAFLALQQKLRAWAAETQKRVPVWLTELRTLDKWLALPLEAVRCRCRATGSIRRRRTCATSSAS